MSKTPTFELQEAHKYFAAHCFNSTLDFIEKKSHTPEEVDQMIQLCMTSLWHWSQRTDATPKNFAVGYWQASRVFALAGKVDEARKYGQLSLEKGQGLEPFYVGYAYEALARSEMVAGNRRKMNEFLGKARELCTKVTDAEEKKLLTNDLETIK